LSHTACTERNRMEMLFNQKIQSGPRNEFHRHIIGINRNYTTKNRDFVVDSIIFVLSGRVLYSVVVFPVGDGSGGGIAPHPPTPHRHQDTRVPIVNYINIVFTISAHCICAVSDRRSLWAFVARACYHDTVNTIWEYKLNLCVLSCGRVLTICGRWYVSLDNFDEVE